MAPNMRARVTSSRNAAVQVDRLSVVEEEAIFTGGVERRGSAPSVVETSTGRHEKRDA
jgi:hypothetical protein